MSRLIKQLILMGGIICCMFISFNSLSAQDANIDELEKELKQLFGLEKLKALNTLTDHYRKAESRKAIRYGRQAVILGENIFETNSNLSQNDQKLLVKAYYQLGFSFYERENFFPALVQFEECQDLGEDIGEIEYTTQAITYANLIRKMIENGEIKENFISKTLGDLKIGEAVTDVSTDLKIQAEIKSGELTEKRGDYDKAIAHYENAINFLKNKGDDEQINELQLKVATLYEEQDKPGEAKLFLDNAIKEIEDITKGITIEFKKDSFINLAEIDQIAIEGLKESQKLEQKSLKDISEQFAKQKDYEKSLAYFKLYQELSQKMVEDSLIAAAEKSKQEDEMLLLQQQKQIADLNLFALEEEKKKQIQLRNTFLLITSLILASAIVIFYFYVAKRREHKKLSIAFRDLDKTKNKLVGAEQKIVKLLSQHLSGDIAQELITNMNNSDKPVERRFVCIMFLDIRDFTPMAEKLSPEEIIEYQNNVFGFMIDIVQKYNGNINQLLGDGFMATFGAPISRGNDCQNALMASKEILKEVRERSEAGFIRKTKVGIGLHAGYVVTGNVGTEARKQYSVTGNPVIIASRVEQLNKTYKSQLIITEEVVDKLENPVENPNTFMEVQVKGRSNPVKILKIA